MSLDSLAIHGSLRQRDMVFRAAFVIFDGIRTRHVLPLSFCFWIRPRAMRGEVIGKTQEGDALFPAT